MNALAALRRRLATARHDLVRQGLVRSSWGGASLVDRALGLVVTTPSGVACRELSPEQLVTVRLDHGALVPSPGQAAAPSPDTPTHLARCRAWPELGGIAHTPSACATRVARAGQPIPALGTARADCFRSQPGTASR